MTDVTHNLVEVAHRLAARGLSPGGSGNVSVREGERVLISPTGGSLARLSAGTLAVIGVDGVPLSGPQPSKESPLHVQVYARRPDVGGIVHLHSPYATALACLLPDADGRLMPVLTPYQVAKLGDPIPLAPYHPPGSRELAAGVAGLAGHDAILMASHGLVTLGATLDAAADLAEELEAAAQLYFTLRGGPHSYRTL